MKKLLFLLIPLFVLFSCVPSDEKTDSEDIAATIAYIPLDDRPINTDRAELLAASCGMELKMPSKELFHTALDGQPKNKNGKQYGDTDALLDWLMGVNADYYVISLDQLLSGGLVNSRAVTAMTDELEKIDRLSDILRGKKVVLFDTVMRLAPTVGYGGMGLKEYNAIREYGRAERVSAETLDGIIAGYNIAPSGDEIKTDTDEKLISDHLAARARKLKISEHILRVFSDEFIYFGIDDSSPEKTIQTNEISFIKSNLKCGSIFAGTDELGLMSIAKIVAENCENELLPQISVKYFGNGELLPADTYDTGTLSDNLKNHMSSLGISEKDSDGDIELLILCGTENIKENAEKLAFHYRENVKIDLPTVIIDLTKTEYLAEALFREGTSDSGYMLGYSSWNTAGNSIGIAVSMGISRYIYLSSVNQSTLSADKAFTALLATAFLKDIVYMSLKPDISEYITPLGLDPNNFYSEAADIEGIKRELFKKIIENDMFKRIISSLSSSYIITSLKDYKTENTGRIEIADISFPWYRIFEARIYICIK